MTQTMQLVINHVKNRTEKGNVERLPWLISGNLDGSFDRDCLVWNPITCSTHKLMHVYLKVIWSYRVYTTFLNGKKSHSQIKLG